jgi:hypothetical protein
MAGLVLALTMWPNPGMDLGRATFMASIKGLARAILPAQLGFRTMNKKETRKPCSNSSGSSSPTGYP